MHPIIWLIIFFFAVVGAMKLYAKLRGYQVWYIYYNDHGHYFSDWRVVAHPLDYPCRFAYYGTRGQASKLSLKKLKGL
jgi:hypothetical protein